MKRILYLMALLCLVFISTAAFAADGVPESIENLEYDGSKRFLVVPNPKDQEPGTETFYYRNTITDKWSSDPSNTPYGIDAITYAVDYIYSDTEPINPSEWKTIYVTIWPRVAELEWGNTTFTADGKSHAPTAKVTNLIKGETCKVTVSGAKKTPGEYVAKATALSNPNYTLPEDAAQAFTIKEGSGGNHGGSNNPGGNNGNGSHASSGTNWAQLSSFFTDETTLPATGFPTRVHTPLSVQPANLAYENLGMRIQIPTLDMDAELTGVPTMGNSWAVEWLGYRAGLLEGTANPGEGYSIVAAHNHLNNTEIGPFVLLSMLEENDRIFVSTDEGGLRFFSVYANKLLGPNDVNRMASIAEQEENSLILITCENESADGGYLNRRVVFAKPLN